jgi:hypothetical protein
VTSTNDLPEWDEEGKVLAVSGLGDPLPDDLASDPQLLELVCCAQEVSASQMYGAWNPEKVAEFLRRTAEIAGCDLDQMCQSGVFMVHNPGSDGWGNPMDRLTLELLSRELTQASRNGTPEEFPEKETADNRRDASETRAPDQEAIPDRILLLTRRMGDLKVGMAKCDVRALLGEPTRVIRNMWEYPAAIHLGKEWIVTVIFTADAVKSFFWQMQPAPVRK